MTLTTKDAITALLDYYGDHGKGKPMEYVYGFMDALSVLRDMDENSCHTTKMQKT